MWPISILILHWDTSQLLSSSNQACQNVAGDHRDNRHTDTDRPINQRQASLIPPPSVHPSLSSSIFSPPLFCPVTFTLPPSLFSASLSTLLVLIVGTLLMWWLFFVLLFSRKSCPVPLWHPLYSLLWLSPKDGSTRLKIPAIHCFASVSFTCSVDTGLLTKVQCKDIIFYHAHLIFYWKPSRKELYAAQSGTGFHPGGSRLRTREARSITATRTPCSKFKIKSGLRQWDNHF